MASTRNILLRLPEDLAAELEQAEFTEHRTATEICRQALAIRLRVVGSSNLDKLLEKAGYQEQRRPGRPARAAAAAANGHDPVPAGASQTADWVMEP